MTETVIGKVTFTRDLLPSAFHLSIRGNGKCMLVMMSEHVHVDSQRLLPVLYELVREHFPGAELPDVGPGLSALYDRNRELEKLCDKALSDHQEQTSKIQALEDKLLLAERRIEELSVKPFPEEG